MAAREQGTLFQFGVMSGIKQSEIRQIEFTKAQDQFGVVKDAIKFVHRGKRKINFISVANVLVIDGWGHPEVEVYATGHSHPDFVSKSLLFTVLSEQWSSHLDEHLKSIGADVIFDGRELVEDPSTERRTISTTNNDSNVRQPKIETVPLLQEGEVHKAMLNRFERNPAARRLCLDHYGYDCRVCDINMVALYGDIGRDFIHVHHRIPLSTINSQYVVDPIADLIPVCPNCHSMIHRRSIAMTVEELRLIVFTQRKNAV